MTDTTTQVREHYNATNLTSWLKVGLATIAAEDQKLRIDQLAPLDQFHTRGILATAELAAAAGLEPSTRVLDLGCGIGGRDTLSRGHLRLWSDRRRSEPKSHRCGELLDGRCGLSDRAIFQVGDALHLPFEDGAFDAVFLHVAMNIADRSSLYAETRRILGSGGRFAIYDVVLREGDVVYPAPWARDASTSFLLSEGDRRKALEQAGFKAVVWRGAQSRGDGAGSVTDRRPSGFGSKVFLWC